MRHEINLCPADLQALNDGHTVRCFGSDNICTILIRAERKPKSPQDIAAELLYAIYQSNPSAFYSLTHSSTHDLKDAIAQAIQTERDSKPAFSLGPQGATS